MNALDNTGQRLIKHPISKVGLFFKKKKWHVLYKKKARYFIDGLFWRHDSTHSVYNDAYNRAKILSKMGFYVTIGKIKGKTEVFEVTNEG